jgi:Flp pilus assembly protein TadG
MAVASILKRSLPITAAHPGEESIKFGQSQQPGLYDKDAGLASPDVCFSGAPVILRSILRPLHACGLSPVPEPHFSGDVMADASIFNRVRSSIARFGHADGGNVAVLFGIAILPILGFVGGAIDYSRVNNARTAMQAALDTTALMISRDATSSMTAAEINQKAQTYFNSLYKHPEAENVVVNATYTKSSTEGSKVVINGSAKMATDFMRVVGYPTLDFGASSTTAWGNTRLRIAMALDITGSMNSSGKLDAMKTAAKSLVDTLKLSAKTADDVYLSIIPFNVMVNVGTSNKTATWLDWDTNYGSCSQSTKKTKSSCVAAGKKWTASNVNNWKGCVTDRTQPYDTTKDVPTTATPATLFLAANYSDCSSSILPMTSVYNSKESDNSTDDTTIKGKINNLVANGSTNQPIGMQWAWMMLQSTDPFVTPAKDSAYKYTDAIILLSDGMNTKDRWYGNGYSWSSEVDDRQTILCNNIKNKTNGSTSVYTIQVNTDGDPESAVLKACADSGSFYSSTSASGIASAFSSIGSSLSKLRLAK